ncbi:MAG: SH3 domain-containing protein [Chlamydiota bacterium]
MYKSLSLAAFLLLCLNPSFAAEYDLHPTAPSAQAQSQKKSRTFSAFTGKITGQNVRMRTQPVLDSDVICELAKGEYIVITGQKGDFYAVTPPSHLKAYIFRGFVIDGVVEGDRVNIRLAPSREAPVISRYNKGTLVPENISADHPKWLEIAMPSDTRFYIAKEYIEYAGNVELKETYEKRKSTVIQLLESTQLFTESELRKPFLEIDMEKISQKYGEIIDMYSDFPHHIVQAKKEHAKAHEKYLHLKIAHLEDKAAQAADQHTSPITAPNSDEQIATPAKIDRMKIWEPIEQSFYLSWSKEHPSQSIDDFYTDQKFKAATTLRGFLAAYSDERIKNKPGDFIVKSRDIPIAYVYSTRVNLQDYVGKEVTLLVSSRPNHRFAFPAFYVLEVQ